MPTGADPIVHVAAGAIEGTQRGPTTAWLGIPYARPPVGPLRFRPPEPVIGWAGVRAAQRYGGAATQSGAWGGPAKQLGAHVGEDCLYLNVFAPSAARADGRGRPVLVWIHGGAYTSGSGALYDGRSLSELGDLVVVTVNYRLGVFGFVDLASVLVADVASNLGLRDQIAALEWVRANIAACGGDPDRVTVAGESAGSVSISLLTCAPAARGLFQAAVMQSGSYTLIHGPEVSEEIARSYARQLGLGRGEGRRLWQLPAEELLAAQRVVDRATYQTVPASPWFDGDVVPESLNAAQAAVRPDLVLLAGHTHDEVTLFQRTRGEMMPTRRADLVRRLRAALGWKAADAIVREYPDTAAGTRALGTDLNFAIPTLHFAERHSRAGGRAYVLLPVRRRGAGARGHPRERAGLSLGVAGDERAAAGWQADRGPPRLGRPDAPALGQLRPRRRARWGLAGVRAGRARGVRLRPHRGSGRAGPVPGSPARLGRP